MTDPTQYLLVPACGHGRHEYTRTGSSELGSRLSVSPAALAAMLDAAVSSAAVRNAATLGAAVEKIMGGLLLDVRSPYDFSMVVQTTWTKPTDLVMCAAAVIMEYRDGPNPTCSIIAGAGLVAHTRFRLSMRVPANPARPATPARSGPFHLVRPASTVGGPTGFKGNGTTGRPKVHLYRGGALSGLGLRENHIERGQPGPSPVLALAAGSHSTVELACVFGRLLDQGLVIYQIGAGGVATPWPVMLGIGGTTLLPAGIIAVPPNLTHRLRL